MNILMLVSNAFTHDPRVYNEAISLIKHGHKVTVIGWDRGKQNKINEIKDGIQIFRVHNTKYMDLLSFDFLRLRPWWRAADKLALRLHEKDNFDVIHCHDLDTLPTGIKLKKKIGIKLVYDAHEIWGYMAEKDFPSFVAAHFLRKEKKLVNQVDWIITVNDALKSYFRGFTDKKITLIMNCKALLGRTYEPTMNDKFTAIYIGSLGDSRFLLEIIETANELPDIQFIIGGMGNKNFIALLSEKCTGISNVNFLGLVPFDDVIPMTKKANLVLCIFDPENKNNKVGLPNKVFEAMVCGRPVMVTKDTYSGKFIEDNKCGFSIDYTKDSFKETLIRLSKQPDICEEMGENALRNAVENYNWEKQEEKLVHTYDHL